MKAVSNLTTLTSTDMQFKSLNIYIDSEIAEAISTEVANGCKHTHTPNEWQRSTEKKTHFG